MVFIEFHFGGSQTIHAFSYSVFDMYLRGYDLVHVPRNCGLGGNYLNSSSHSLFIPFNRGYTRSADMLISENKNKEKHGLS